MKSNRLQSIACLFASLSPSSDVPSRQATLFFSSLSLSLPSANASSFSLSLFKYSSACFVNCDRFDRLLLEALRNIRIRSSFSARDRPYSLALSISIQVILSRQKTFTLSTNIFRRFGWCTNALITFSRVSLRAVPGRSNASDNTASLIRSASLLPCYMCLAIKLYHILSQNN